ncbi:hypothetical protein J6590_015104 [Homalodisca vitripennis]|nr:hypothetical protein J6590_015104 [Homalodisca vitripennis]
MSIGAGFVFATVELETTKSSWKRPKVVWYIPEGRPEGVEEPSGAIVWAVPFFPPVGHRSPMLEWDKGSNCSAKLGDLDAAIIPGICHKSPGELRAQRRVDKGTSSAEYVEHFTARRGAIVGRNQTGITRRD